MSERKVLNKYYPPDFDPEKLQRLKKLSRKSDYRNGKRYKRDTKQMNVRMMFPFTFRCSYCQDFIYVGTKFNSRVEKVLDEDYLGIIIWRFYGRCPACRGEISFKTDPKNADYILEWGGVRTYDARKDAEMAQMKIKELKENELEEDKIKQIEEKSFNTAFELQELEEIEKLKKINKRNIDFNSVIDNAINFFNYNNDNIFTADEEKQYELLLNDKSINCILCSESDEFKENNFEKKNCILKNFESLSKQEKIKLIKEEEEKDVLFFKKQMQEKKELLLDDEDNISCENENEFSFSEKEKDKKKNNNYKNDENSNLIEKRLVLDDKQGEQKQSKIEVKFIVKKKKIEQDNAFLADVLGQYGDEEEEF